VHFPDEVRVIPEPAKRLIIELLSKDPEGRPNAESLFNHDFITSYLVGNKEQLSNKERLTEK
jgi:serine/threonine protein kinase